MPKADGQDTPPRRKVLASIPAFTIASAAGAAVAPDALAASHPATIEDWGAVRFGDEGPGVQAAIGPLDAWLDRARTEHTLVQFAAAMLRKDDVATCAGVKQMGVSAFVDFAESLRDLQGRYEGLAGMLQTTVTRLTAALSRHELLAGKGPGQ